jgi:hypothetical protein
MDIENSLKIIQALAGGCDPYSGEEYPADSPYQQAETVRALFMAKEALERNKMADERLRNLPGNAGKAWEAEEDSRLLAAFDSGKTIELLAKDHERTKGSICARLVKHGKIQ